MNTKELARAYGVSDEVFYSWLKLVRDKVGRQVGRMWTIKQIKIMFDHFGTPGE